MKILNVKQVQELLGLSKSSTYKLLKNPNCPTLKVGGNYKIMEEDLLNFLKQNNKNQSS